MQSVNRPQLLPITLVILVTHFLSTTQRAECALVTDATSFWTPITYAGPNQTDYHDDQQTGNATSSPDLVGDASNPAFFTQYDDGGTPGTLTDGTLFFARLGAPERGEGWRTQECLT